MSSFFKFAAVFQTSLIRNAPSKVIIDPIKIEFFTGPRVLHVPVQTALVLAKGQEIPFSQGANLSLQNGPFLSITVRTTEDDPYRAKRFCEDYLDSTITHIAVAYDPGLFAHQVYRGWLIEEKKAIMEAWIQLKDPLDIPNDLLNTINAMSSALVADPDLKARHELMSRFLAKSLLVPPSEEKFLYLWTILEIFPMKDTTNIKSIGDYLGQVIGRDPAVVKEKLGIGRLFGIRSDLVHNGRLEIAVSETGETLCRLEAICIEVLRTMCRQKYSGSLEKYF